MIQELANIWKEFKFREEVAKVSVLQDKFNAIIAKIEERITDKEELDFIKEQIVDL